MLSAAKLQNAKDAEQYYAEVDDYRREGDSAPTKWMGQGAERLGLQGEVEKQDFIPLLEGKLPDGQALSRKTAEGDDHAPGWDFTFSAPKSVSIAALVGKDERLVKAHDQAVETAVGYLEQYGATTRVRTADQGVENIATGELTVATYRHTTSRKMDPQLHTHAVVLNATHDGERWRSLDSRGLYRMKSEASDVYRTELARAARDLGYAVEHDPDANAGRTGFRLSEVPRNLEQNFSKRSQEIEEALAKRGKDRDSASRTEKQTATLDTRDRKGKIDHSVLADEWGKVARDLGADPQRMTPKGNQTEPSGMSAAQTSLQEAVAHLSERDTRFSRQALEIAALRFGEGRATLRDVRSAVDEQHKAKTLVPATTWGYDASTGKNQRVEGFTTDDGQRLERRMLELAGGDAKTVPLSSRTGTERIIQSIEQNTGHSFNESQKAATHGVLSGDRRVNIVQGYAGTSKTNSVIVAAARGADLAGKEFVGLAATHNAKDELASATQRPAQTVAGFLAAKPPGSDTNRQRVYVVDEASLISARDMTKLLDRTRGAQVVLVGDEKQLGSVQAGAAFRQLQESDRVPVHRLDQIVRQRDEQLKSAVYDAIRGSPADAMRKLKVDEVRVDAASHPQLPAGDRRAADRSKRVDHIAALYANSDPKQREQTLVVTPGRDDREQVNHAIRQRQVDRGDVSRNSIQITSLSRVDMTEVELKKVTSYQPGLVVVPQRDYKAANVSKDERLTVVGIDAQRGKLALTNERGEAVTLDPRKQTKLGLFERKTLEIGEGDLLVAGERLPARRAGQEVALQNGERLKVTKAEEGGIQVQSRAGQSFQLDVSQRAPVLNHGYASTAHAAQGMTYDRVIGHFESTRLNLANQQTFYVAISRAREDVTIVTDDKKSLAQQIARESGQNLTALGSVLKRGLGLSHD